MKVKWDGSSNTLLNMPISNKALVNAQKTRIFCVKYVPLLNVSYGLDYWGQKEEKKTLSDR